MQVSQESISRGCVADGPMRRGISYMKRKLVGKKKFDTVLSSLLKAQPMPRASVKSMGKRSPKTPIRAKQ